jgi:hypothetical protein
MAASMGSWIMKAPNQASHYIAEADFDLPTAEAQTHLIWSTLKKSVRLEAM